MAFMKLVLPNIQIWLEWLALQSTSIRSRVRWVFYPAAVDSPLTIPSLCHQSPVISLGLPTRFGIDKKL